MMGMCIIPSSLMFGFLALVLSGVSFKSAESCSIYCENGKIPCGAYNATCEGFTGCAFPGECSQSNTATVPTNYDVMFLHFEFMNLIFFLPLWF